MNQWLLIFAMLFSLSNLFADKVIYNTLPSPNYLDTEVSTNISLPLCTTSHKIAIDLVLNIASSNQYDISFGGDLTPNDGSLSSCETTLSLGFDDSWYLVLPKNTIKYTAPYTIEQNQVVANINILQNSEGIVNELSFKENQNHLFLPEIHAALSSKLRFNHIKITKRGINASCRDIVIKNSPLATKVILQ